MKEELLFEENEPCRLDSFLTRQINQFSRTKIQKIINEGHVKVDGFIVKSSFILKGKEVISYELKSTENNIDYVVPEKMNLNVLFEDNDIIVINKSAGIVVHPAIGNKTGTLLNGLLYHCKDLSEISMDRPGVIHRLDKNTSGVIVFAKNDRAHYYISDQFAERKVKKKYIALVWGKLVKNGSIKGKIKRNPKNRLGFILNDKIGKDSFSEYRVIENFDIPVTLVNIFPKTGRTHQIRVHLSSIGHPIINDHLYGGGEASRINSFHEKNRSSLLKVCNLSKRVSLHASEIEFKHPSNKKIIKFKADLSNDIYNAINYLRTA